MLHNVEVSAKEHLKRGNDYLKQGHVSAAITEYTDAITLNPNYFSAYHNRGNAYLDQGYFTAAISDYAEALKLNPTHPRANNNHGYALQSQGDIAAAINSYDAALKLDPTYANAYNNRGSAHQALGHFAAAILDYSRTIHLQAGDKNAFLNLIDVLNKQKVTYYLLQDILRLPIADTRFLLYKCLEEDHPLGKFFTAEMDEIGLHLKRLDPNFTATKVLAAVGIFASEKTEPPTTDPFNNVCADNQFTL